MKKADINWMIATDDAGFLRGEESRVRYWVRRQLLRLRGCHKHRNEKGELV